MNAPETHLGKQGASALAERPCATCETIFTPGRAWATFCSTRCRNAHHAAEARVEKIRERAVAMYQALERIRDGLGDDFGDQAPRDLARELLKDLKPPVSPKVLLEGRK